MYYCNRRATSLLRLFDLIAGEIQTPKVNISFGSKMYNFKFQNRFYKTRRGDRSE